MNLLFLGASNTDCGHCFTADNLGNGYVKHTAELLKQYAAESESREPFPVINGGTDGFTFPRIYQKWKANWQQYAFDFVCILGGINEVGALMDSGCTAKAYRTLLADSADAFSQLLCSLNDSGCRTILVLEPFLFSQPDYLKLWQPCLEDVRSMIQTVIRDTRIRLSVPGSKTESAKKLRNPAEPPFSVRYVPTQCILDHAVRKYGTAAVTADGIHLTSCGHDVLARALVREITAPAERTLH